MQAAPSIIPCWAAGLTFGVLQFLPMLTHKTAGIYMPWVLQMLYRRRIRQHYKIEVGDHATVLSHNIAVTYAQMSIWQLALAPLPGFTIV